MSVGFYVVVAVFRNSFKKLFHRLIGCCKGVWRFVRFRLLTGIYAPERSALPNWATPRYEILPKGDVMQTTAHPTKLLYKQFCKKSISLAAFFKKNFIRRCFGQHYKKVRPATGGFELTETSDCIPGSAAWKYSLRPQQWYDPGTVRRCGTGR